VGRATEPGVPNAKVTDWPAPEIVRPEAELSDAVQEVEVPVRDIVPLNCEPVSFLRSLKLQTGDSKNAPKSFQYQPPAS